MLIYHFGSKEGLLVEVVRTVEARQRRVLDELVASAAVADPGAGDAAPVGTRSPGRWVGGGTGWPIRPCGRSSACSSSSTARPSRVGSGWPRSWTTSSSRGWRRPPRLGRQLGLDATAARDQARLGLAVTRGLLLDLLATGDRAGVDRAMARYIEGVIGSLFPRPSDVGLALDGVIPSLFPTLRRRAG